MYITNDDANSIHRSFHTGDPVLKERYLTHMFSETATPRLHVLSSRQWCTYNMTHNASTFTLSAGPSTCYDVQSSIYTFAGMSTALVTSPDDDAEHTLRFLKVQAGASSLITRWAHEYGVVFSGTSVTLTKASGTTVKMTFTHEQQCNYMTCTSCRDTKTQQLCMAAQNCMLSECIGTRVHTSNVFCTAGLLAREFGEEHSTDFVVLWQGLVEVLRVGITTGVLGIGATGPLRIESVANRVTTTMCEAKDIVAVGSALLPTLLATVVNAGRRVRMSDFSLNPTTHQFAAVSRELSPALRLFEIQYLSAGIQVLAVLFCCVVVSE
tara:strand:- start:50 stop:1021 length:972 start_codon:yes stop_codon:yes gene_type:complete